MLRSRLPAVLCLGLLFLAACDSDDPGEVVDGPLGPAAADPGTWYFVETEGARCRDGSPTGFGVRFAEGAVDAQNVAIYLEGGGACFNEETCASNRTSFTAEDFAGFVGFGGDFGLFSPLSTNPLSDWTAVYVPYCTGDVHGGRAPDATVPGVDGTQQFVGHLNVERYLDVLTPVLGGADRVLLTGSSAGGFGTLVNFGQVADAFPNAERTLLNDSGPAFFADDVFSPSLGGAFTALYNFPAAFPADAAPLFAPDGLEGVYAYYAERYPDATFGLSSYTQDATIRGFFGFGQPDGTISGAEYEAALLDVRAQTGDRWGTYFVPGEDHTFLRFPDRYTSAYQNWLGDLLNGTPRDVGP